MIIDTLLFGIGGGCLVSLGCVVALLGGIGTSCCGPVLGVVGWGLPTARTIY